MFNKLIKQSLKPWSRVMHEKAYKDWLRLFDLFKDETIKYPLQVKAMGFNWLVHHGAAFLNQFDGIFIQEIYKFNSNTKQPVIIDCGANMGTSVLYFKWLFPTANVFAFEPDKHIFEVLKNNIENNNLSNIVLQNKAVWIDNNDMFFAGNNAQSGKLVLTANEVKVSCLRLKNFMKDFDAIDFLKLDIEGAELPVLLDISDELHKVKHLFIEYHSSANNAQELSKLLQVLEKENFRYYIGGSQMNSPFVNKIVEDGMDLTLDIFAVKN